VLVLAPRAFNALGSPLVAPITTGGNFAREQGFAVSLSGAGIHATGVTLCNQLRSLNLKARGAKFSEKMPEFIMDEVLARMQPLFE
jgi:mRNA-degrading endonuclease toxin of MazEF toxin-antitoxin module